jgi:hypothetical protein
MSRFKVFAVAAILALGSLTIATEASARGGHGHFGGFHHGFGGFHHGFGGFHHGFGFYGGGYRYWGAPYYYGYYPYAGCWRLHRVWTPFGPRLHRINVCAYRYYRYY